MYWEAFSQGLTIEESQGFIYRLRFPSDVQFDSNSQLFHHLRHALSMHLGGRFLSIKFARIVTSMDIPVIHDPDQSRLNFYHDPLFVFRDAVAQANHDRFIDLHRMDSRSAYFRQKIRHSSTSTPGNSHG